MRTGQRSAEPREPAVFPSRRRSPLTPGRSRFLRAVLVASVLALCAVSLLRPNPYPIRAAQSFAVLGIVVAAAWRALRRERPGWGPIALGAGMWLLALLLGWLSVTTDHQPLRDTARTVFTGGALIALIGMSRLLAAPTTRRSVIQAFDALVVTSAVGIVLAALVDPHLDLEVVRGELWTPLAAPIASLVAAGFAFTAAMNQPERILPRWMAAGFGLGVLADLVQMVEITDGVVGVTDATVAAPLMAASSVALLIAVTTPDSADGGQPAHAALPRRRRPVLTVVVLVALGVATVAVVADAGTRPIMLTTALVMVVSQTFALLIALSELSDEQASSRAALDMLRNSEARLHLAIDAAPVGIAVADDRGRIVVSNRALADLLGTPPETLVGRRWADFLSRSARMPTSLGGRSDVWALRRPDGEVRLVELDRRRYPSPDGRLQWLATAVDVTGRVQALQELEHRATHDELTDLPNRRFFTDHLRARITDETGGVLAVFDLDQFKFVNDTLGHSAGDRLLNVMAQRIRGLQEIGAEVARIGGDEFCVLLPEDVRDPLDKVAALFAEPFRLDDDVLHATASVGGTVLRPGTTPDSLVAEADAAMYRAKALGPGRREMYHAETGLSMARYRRTLAGLHRALDSDELEIWYQPIWNLETGRITAYEALLRWRHPYRGLLGPGDFILDAERSGLISEIGERVLRRALGEAARRHWDREGIALSVNVSAGQIGDPEFVGTVASALEDSSFDPGRLWLEITESALLTDARMARRTCEELRSLGAHLAIDDFGTGYGSLTYLVEFPVESIKIDRSFVAGLGRPDPHPGSPVPAEAPSEREEAIVAALVGLTRRLGLRCVAEGVEDEAQLRALVALGVTLAQGHHFGRPQRDPQPRSARIPALAGDPGAPLHADSEGVS